MTLIRLSCGIALLALSGCIQTTGGNAVSFQAYASGDPDIVSGGALHFTTPVGYEVTLTRAQLTVGAMYFNQQNPLNYTLEQSCIQEGIYTGEIRGLMTVDALSAVPQPFPVLGVGTDMPTRSAELWLTGGDLLAERDLTTLLDVAGEATRGADSFPFVGKLTISENRVIPPRNPALPGSNPLCRQRIVSPISFDAQLHQDSVISLLVDARAWFSSVNFEALKVVNESPRMYQFTDDSSSSAQPDQSLYNAMRSTQGPYRFVLQE